MKKIIAIFAVVGLLFTLCACTPSTPDITPNPDSSSSQSSKDNTSSESSSESSSETTAVSLIKDGYVDLLATKHLSHRELELVDVCWLDASRLIIAAELEEDDSDKDLLRIVIVNIDNGEESLLWEGENDMEDEYDTIATDGEYVYYRCKTVTTKRIKLSDGTTETATDLEGGKGIGKNIPYLGKAIVTKELEGEENYQLLYDDIFAGVRRELATESITSTVKKYEKYRKAENVPYTMNPIKEWSPDGEYILFGYRTLTGPRGYFTDVGEHCTVYALDGSAVCGFAYDGFAEIEHFWTADSDQIFFLQGMPGDKEDTFREYTIASRKFDTGVDSSYHIAFTPNSTLSHRLVFSSDGGFCVFLQQNADESRSLCKYNLGGEVTELCRLPDAFGYDYVTAEISHDDSRIVYRLSEDDSMLVCIADVK